MTKSDRHYKQKPASPIQRQKPVVLQSTVTKEGATSSASIAEVVVADEVAVRRDT